MTRPGDTVLILGVEGIATVISTREPVLGQKCIIIPDGTGGNIAIKPFNTYDHDEGVAMPLPCGSAGYVVSEPPNYLPPSFESGVPMSCQQGQPSTNGWTCSSGCPINPSTHPTPGETCRRAYGLPLLWTDENACTHSLGSGSWRANKEYHWDVTLDYYGCRSRCYQIYEDGTPQGYKVYCPLYGKETVVGHYMSDGHTSGTTYPNGCYKTSNRYVKRIRKVAILDGQIVDAFYSYACNGPKTVCPRFNGGSGTPFPVCGIKGANDKGPSFSPGQKPAGCKNHAHLSFDGWVIPGGEETVSTKRCDLTKATEGIRSNSDGGIVCKFFSPSGQIGQTVNSGDVRLPISPDTPNQYGKAGSILSASATISIPGSISSDYTRVPSRQQKSGTACIFTIGRY